MFPYFLIFPKLFGILTQNMNYFFTLSSIIETDKYMGIIHDKILRIICNLQVYREYFFLKHSSKLFVRYFK